MDTKKIMMNASIILYMLFNTTTSRAQQTNKLTIEASAFVNNTGKAVVNLYRLSDDMPRKPFMQATSEISNGKATIIFNAILYSEYAAILFHDINSNGILDHRFGFPNEPMGFSNGWNLTLFSGMPTFNKLRFRFDEEHTTYIIVIR